MLHAVSSRSVGAARSSRQLAAGRPARRLSRARVATVEAKTKEEKKGASSKALAARSPPNDGGAGLARARAMQVGRTRARAQALRESPPPPQKTRSHNTRANPMIARPPRRPDPKHHSQEGGGGGVQLRRPGRVAQHAAGASRERDEGEQNSPLASSSLCPSFSSPPRQLLPTNQRPQ